MADSFAVVDGQVQDIPEVKETPEVKEEVKEEVKDETPEVKEVKDDSDIEDVEEEPEHIEEKKPKQTASERVRQVVNEKNAEREARIRAEERAATLQAIIEGKQTETISNEKPRQEQFDTYEAYENAKDEWLLNQGEARAMAKFQSQEANKVIKSKLTEASTKFKDFDTIAGVDSPLATYMLKNPYMDSATWNDSNFPAIAYHLGKNLDEAARISALPPLQAVIEIGKLSERLSRPADVKVPKEPSKAPEPVKTVTGGGAVVVDESKLSMSEWAKLQNKLEREKRGNR